MRRQRFIPLFGIILVLLLIVLIWGMSKNPLLEALSIALGDQGLTLFSRLGVWIDRFGEPLTVPQLDDTHTFFYWPANGIAVFTHPHYRAQHRQQDRRQWVVTAIYLPLRKQIHPYMIPVVPEFTVYFDSLLTVPIDNKDVLRMDVEAIKSLYLFSFSPGPAVINLSNFPLPFLFHDVEVYMQNNEIEVLVFNETSWGILSYD